MKRTFHFIMKEKPEPKASVRGNGYHFWDSQKHLRLIIGIEMQRQFKNQPLFQGPIHATYLLAFPFPKRWKQSQKIEGRRHYSKPDRDNCEKMYGDCGTGIIYKDDCQICDGALIKIYSHEPRIEIYYKELDELEIFDATQIKF